MKYKVGDIVTVEICNYEKDAIITDINEFGIEVRLSPNYSDCLVIEEERIKQTNRQWLESLSDEEQGITISELFDEWYLGFYYEPKTITDIFAAWFTKWLQAERTTV